MSILNPGVKLDIRRKQTHLREKRDVHVSQGLLARGIAVDLEEHEVSVVGEAVAREARGGEGRAAEAFDGVCIELFIVRVCVYGWCRDRGIVPG